MNIVYIFRRKGYSIEKVFSPIIDEVEKHGYVVSAEKVKQCHSLLFTLIHNMWYFAKISRNNICHITGDIQYVACFMNSKTTVMTIHDMVSLHNPSVPWYSRLLCYWLWYYIPLRRLRHITCISEATKMDIISKFPWAADKLTVIRNPVDKAYKYTLKILNLDYPRILQIGTKNNKNLNRVIESLNGVPCHLRIIGKLTEENIALLNQRRTDYSYSVNLTDEEILKEYIDADIVSFPSMFEGFGMPILEAQAIGRPVLTSNIEPMLSVCGGAAELVDPNDVTSIHNGFKSMVESKSRCEYYVNKGLDNVKRYSVANICNQYLKIYQSL